jgi:hypothetical protein
VEHKIKEAFVALDVTVHVELTGAEPVQYTRSLAMQPRELALSYRNGLRVTAPRLYGQNLLKDGTLGATASTTLYRSTPAWLQPIIEELDRRYAAVHSWGISKTWNPELGGHTEIDERHSEQDAANTAGDWRWRRLRRPGDPGTGRLSDVHVVRRLVGPWEDAPEEAK